MLPSKLTNPPACLLELDPRSEVNGCFSALPMGFSWAFYITQEVHRGFVALSLPEVSPSSFAVERRPSPVLEHDSDKAAMIYADNSHHVSLLAQEANAMRESLSLARNKNGLATHEVVEATHIAEGLGAVINMKGGVVSSQAKRVW